MSFLFLEPFFCGNEHVETENWKKKMPKIKRIQNHAL